MKIYNIRRIGIISLVAVMLVLITLYFLMGFYHDKSKKNNPMGGGQTNESEYDIGKKGFVEYPIKSNATLKIWAGEHLVLDSIYSISSESPFHSGLSVNTGVNVEWSWTKGTDQNEEIKLMIAKDNLPDIILYSNPSDIESLIEAGYILSLNDYIEDYAPNLYAHINKNPEIDKAIKTDSGYYYMFPFLRDSIRQATFQGPVIRNDWLNELGLEIPNTIDELNVVLEAFSESFGGKFVTNQPWMNAALIGAWGINRGYYIDDDGKIQRGEAQESYKRFLEQMNEWYKTDILDHDFATIEPLALTKKVVNNEIGFTITTSGILSGWIGEAEEAGVNINWLPIENLTLVEGAMVEISQMENSANGMGAIITSNCKDIEAAMRFLDWGYSEEGIRYWNYGTEGISYDMVEGKPIFKEGIIENDLYKYVGMQWGGISIAQWGLFEQKNIKVAVDAVETWTRNTNMSSHLLPLLSATTEESAELSLLESSMDSYIDEMYYKFIMGEVNLNRFDEYIETLENQYRITDILRIKQAQLERYNNR